MRLPTLALVLTAWLAAAACSSASSSATSAASDAGVDAVADAARVEQPHVVLPDVLAEGLAEPRGLVLVGDALYVAERGADRIVVVPRTGGAPRVFFAGLHAPTSLATDGAAIAVAERDDVVRVALDGRSTVLEAAAAAAIRFHQGDLYALQGDADAGALVRIGSDGGARTIATGLLAAHDLALHGDAAYVTAQGGVLVAPIDGDAAAPLAPTSESLLGVTADDTHVYWAARKGTSVGGSEGWIRRAGLVGLDGGAAEAIVEVPYGPDRVAAHGAYVYFTNYQTLSRAPLAGGPREDLALHTSVADLVVTDDAVYWTDADAGKLRAVTIAATH